MTTGTAIRIRKCLTYALCAKCCESKLNLPLRCGRAHTDALVVASLRRINMNPIRVLVANRPRLIRELLLATISDQPDIEVVGEIQQETELESAVEATRPDFLIV